MTGLDTALAGKAATAHSHAQGDVTNLATDLAGKAASSHSHAQGDVTGLVTALSGKSDTAHTHTTLAATGAITSSGGGIGYAAGAGGTVTQATSRTTGVTLSKLCGNITMFSAAQAAAALVTFTLTNTLIAATDVLIVQHISATNGGSWGFSTVCGSGSATISIKNITTASITSATPLRFFLLKGVTS